MAERMIFVSVIIEGDDDVTALERCKAVKDYLDGYIGGHIFNGGITLRTINFKDENDHDIRGWDD